MNYYKFENIPKRYNKNLEDLNELISKNNPAEIIIKEFFSGFKLKSLILVTHRPLGQAARFYKDKIYLNFANESKYLWLCLCHETAHIIFRLSSWGGSRIYKILKENYKGKILPKNKVGIIHAVDQSCAILIQAFCENLLRIRPLEWKDWESTFSYMDVEEIGRVLWPEWLGWIENKDGLSIFDWLLMMEEKGMFKKLKFSK